MVRLYLILQEMYLIIGENNPILVGKRDENVSCVANSV